MIRLLCCFFSFVFFVLTFVFPETAYADNINISAESAVVMDAYSQKILFEKNPDINKAVASTTKIMTCLIACESNRLSETVKITSDMLEGCEGSLIYLNEGDKITLYDLVCGAMIASGNDAANAIAFFISGSIEEFASLMNSKAKSLGMNSTKFVTPSGLDKDGNHSTAGDMAILASYAVFNKTLMEIASMKSAEITVNEEKTTIYNHNKLLSFSESFIGLKTGYTEIAGRCLISAYKYKRNIIICVTLNAPDDWEDHKTLVKYAKKCYKDISQKETIKISTVGAAKNCVACEFEYKLKTAVNVKTLIYYYPFAYAPIKCGDKLGYAEIYVNNTLIKTVDIIAKEDVK